MTELEEDLRATAEAVAADAERLAAIEREKQSLDSDDPRLLELSVAAEAIAKALVPKTIAERRLAAEVAGDSQAAAAKSAKTAPAGSASE